MKPLPSYLPAIRLSPKTSGDQDGFTLVEVILAMVILGVLAALMSTGIANIIQGYIFTRDNADTALKGQVALTRITKELRSLDTVTAGTQTSITYSYKLRGTQISGRTLSWNGTAGSSLLLGGNVLVDGVENFILSYHLWFNDPGATSWNGTHTLINVTITLQGASNHNTSFSAQVVPRTYDNEI